MGLEQLLMLKRHSDTDVKSRRHLPYVAAVGLCVVALTACRATGRFEAGSRGAIVARASKGDHAMSVESGGRLSDEVRQVSASNSGANRFACALKADWRAVCWGDNTYGQARPPSGRFRRLSAGSAYACGVRFDGRLVCWGANFSRVARPPQGRFEEVSAGSLSACALGSTGDITCWGNKLYGETKAPPGRFLLVSMGGGLGALCALGEGPYVGASGTPARRESPATASQR